MDNKAARIQQMIARAQALGLRVDVSGHVYFIHGADVTIRIVMPHGYISSNTDPDQTRPRALSVGNASKLLKLPRK